MTYETKSVSNMVDMLMMYRDEAIGCKYGACALKVYTNQIKDCMNKLKALQMMDIGKDMEFEGPEDYMISVRVKTYTTDADIEAVAGYLIGDKT